MSPEKITINGIEVKLAEIQNLLHENRKLEAVKLVFETCNCGLKEAKDAVDNIELGNFDMSNLQKIPSNTTERVWAQKKNGSIVVTYSSGNNEKVVVTPADTLWQRVKAIAQNNNPLINEYETSFNNGTLPEPKLSKSSSITRFIDTPAMYFVFLFIVVAIVVAIFFF